MFETSLILFYSISLISATPQIHPPPDCDSEIYCHGSLLFDVQTNLVGKYRLSEYFVNLKLKTAPNIILEAYEDIVNVEENYNDDLKKLIDTNFEPYTAERFILSDHKEIPNLDESILNEDYRKFASSISKMWSGLSVRTSEDVIINSHLHSLIFLPNGYIKSNQFSSTMEYWESYYAFRGLLVNEMFDSALRMILNCVYMISNYGFVLQSNRVYFSRRPQTPMLGLMVEDYLAAAGNGDGILQKILPMMEIEFLWWVRHRLARVELKDGRYYLFRYYYRSEEPRPEEYKTDYSLASKFEDWLGKQEFTSNKSYKTVKKQHSYFTAAHSLSESGFGYASRFNRKYFRIIDKSSFNRLNTDVKNFIPVELNCILQRYAFLLMKWNKYLKHNAKAEYFQKIFVILTKAIERVLWNEDKKMWFDWDLIKKEHNVRFSPTNLMPLFTLSYDSRLKAQYGEYAVNYLIKEGIISSKYPYGPNYFIIPTSNDWTGETWDYPFGSPLLNLFVIEGLKSTGHSDAMQAAFGLAQRLVKTCYEGYVAYKSLFKEYDGTKSGSNRKTWGQRDPKFSESGYAPTNGAVLVLLKLYGRTLNSEDDKINFIPMFNFIPLL